MNKYIMAQYENDGPRWCSEKNKWVLPMSSKDLGYSRDSEEDKNTSSKISSEKSRLQEEVDKCRQETKNLEGLLRFRTYENRPVSEEITRRKNIIENLRKEISKREQKLAEVHEEQKYQYEKEIRDLKWKITQRYEEIDYLEKNVLQAIKSQQQAKAKLAFNSK